jgi:hypothetical protein
MSATAFDTYFTSRNSSTTWHTPIQKNFIELKASFVLFFPANFPSCSRGILKGFME